MCCLVELLSEMRDVMYIQLVHVVELTAGLQDDQVGSQH